MACFAGDTGSQANKEMRMYHVYRNREAALNWLALGLLLAAWNAADDAGVASQPPRRPAALQGYAFVSVRALQRLAPITTARLPKDNHKVAWAMNFSAKGHSIVNVL
jgi:hypothetical protein